MTAISSVKLMRARGRAQHRLAWCNSADEILASGDRYALAMLMDETTAMTQQRLALEVKVARRRLGP